MLRLGGIALLLWSGIAFSSCIPLPEQALRPLDERINVDPMSVLRAARRELERAKAADVSWRASLEAILSEAFYQVERDREARDTASTAMSHLAGRPLTDPLRVRLMLTRVGTADSAADVEAGIAQSNQILQTLPTATLPYACALLARARMYQAQNRLDLAVADALITYRLAAANHWDEARALAAEAIGIFYADTGDLDEARRFLAEAVDYEESRHATNWLAVGHYVMGRLELRAGQYDRAAEEGRKSAALSAVVGDMRSVAMSKTLMCIALTRGGKLGEAQPLCDAAESGLRDTDRTDLFKSAVAAHAGLLLAQHDAAGAIRELDLVLADEGRDIEPRALPNHYLSRSRAHAALGQFQAAYEDFNRFYDLTQAANASERRRSIAVLRTRFETERAIEHGRVLQRENDEQRELLERRSEVTRLWAAVSFGAAAVIGLLFYVLRARQRHAGTLEAQTRILQSMNEGVMLLESDGSLRCINGALASAFGYGFEEFRVLNLAALGIDVDPRRGSALEPHECLLRRKDGSEFSGMVAFTSMAPRNPGEFICVIQDITERKRLERALLEVSAREQRHFGQELHDGLGQELTGLALLARGIAGEASKQASPMAQDLEHLSQIASRAIETCRGVARGLSPAGEVQGGLVQALQDLTARVAAMHAIRVEFRQSLEVPLRIRPETGDHVYRIAQEALANAVKHSGASRIEVELQASSTKVRLQITDNGNGLKSDIPVSSGLGLRTMRYRASLIGARISIGPVGPSGTTVMCEWPQLPER